LEIGPQKISLWRLFDQEIWLDWFDLERESEVPKEVAIGNHRRSERVASDLAMKLLFDFSNVLDMIDVAVR
jgi:hypothetical protein